MQRSFLASCLAIVLAACGTMSYYGDENSPYFVVPRDSRLVLTRTLTIPPERVAVLVQNGQVMRFSDVDHYYPFCKFELFTRLADSRTVEPDEFVVTRAQQEESLSSLGTPTYAGLMLAQFGMDGAEFGGQPLMIYSTHMYLHSTKQPDVYRLTCAHWVYQPNDQHVTIAEMRRTLGDLIQLRLAGT